MPWQTVWDKYFLGGYKSNSLYETQCYKCEFYRFTYGNNILITFVIKYAGMKDRLIQLLDLEQLSPSKFADIIGVQRSSISHVLSGRNKPSFDFLQKTLKAFPGLNASWLMLGEGTMYEQMGRPVSGNLFDTKSAPEVPDELPEPSEEKEISEMEENGSSKEAQENQEVKHEPVTARNLQGQKPEDTGSEPSSEIPRRIVQVLVFYDDDTFRAYKSTR